MRFSTAAFILGTFAPLVQAAVVHLTEANFRDVIDGSQHAIVEFYAPWCGHCKNLAPEWEIVGDTYKDGDGVVVAAVDATANQALASEFGVKGYPTIKYFPKGSTNAQEFEGGRTADTIINWVNKQTGLQRKLKKAPSSVTDLTADTFDSLVNAPGTFALVEFFAPWCGHCKSLAPKYEKLAQAFSGDNDVLIAKVDATEQVELARRFEVTGYPTLVYFEKGTNKEPSRYNGAREEAALVSFVNEKAGTHRNVDGSLKETAGRIDALDALVKGKATTADAALLRSLKEAVQGLAATEQEIGDRYVKVVEKILAKGADYVGKEVKRLSGMIQGGSIHPEKKTGLQLRQNVLKAFM